MFEVNEKLDITVVSDIGNEKRCALIIDNFYKDPDSIRDYIETINLVRILTSWEVSLGGELMQTLKLEIIQTSIR